MGVGPLWSQLGGRWATSVAHGSLTRWCPPQATENLHNKLRTPQELREAAQQAKEAKDFKKLPQKLRGTETLPSYAVALSPPPAHVLSPQPQDLTLD